MFPQAVTTFDEEHDLSDILKVENLLDFNYQELQTKYNILCKTYAEEIETSAKIKKSLGKCLKFYSKLCKKYEAQQITIDSLQKTIKQKMNCLEESLKNQEKMKGLIDVYKRERMLYCAESNVDLKKDKEILLDICCKLISESVKTNNIQNVTNLILKKFKNDLDKDKINLLKEKQIVTKPKSNKLKKSVLNLQKPDSKFVILEKNFVTKNIENLENRNVEKNKNCDINQLEKLDLDSIEILKVESKNTNEISTENDSQKIKDLEQLNDYYSIEKIFSNENEEKINKLNEKVPSILPLSSNLVFFPEKLDLEFKKVNSNYIKDDSKVILKENGNIDFNNTEKNDRNKCDTDNLNTNAKTDSSVLFSEIKTNNVKAFNINNFKLKQGNKDVCQIEELSSENSEGDDEKPFVDNILENDRRIIPTCFNENVKENCEAKLNQNENNDNNNKNTLRPKLNNINLNFEYGNSLQDSQRNFETKKIKIEALSYSVRRDVGNREKYEGEKTVFKNFGNLDSSLKVTENKPVNSEICVQNNNDGLNCQYDYNVTLFNNTEKNLNFLNCNSDDKPKSEILDWEKMEANNAELSRIFEEMSTLRLLSPIREMNESHQIFITTNGKNDDKKICETLSETKSRPINQNLSIKLEKRKSPICDSRHCKKIKLNKKKNCKRVKKEATNGLLDTIMEAMSTQNAQFKLNSVSKTEVSPAHQTLNSYVQIQNAEKNLQEKKTKRETHFNNKINQPCGETISVTQKIEQFISSSISSSEEAQKNVEDCLAALEKFSVIAISKSVVGLVMANIDEKVEIFERPVPPLTKTQCRLVTLLSVLKTQNEKFEKMVDIILEKISQKLFPDNFFWPDDSVEMACRFYTALCKNRNDSENLWKFCVQAMIDMKQRSCVVIFTVLKTWPDILHEEPTLKNNILATTIVNIILHTSLNNTLANGNQKKKLLALKHLLMNFYGFKVNVSIEEFADTLLESFFKNEPLAEKSLVLLIKCRDVVWTSKHVFPKLGKVLKEWSQNFIDDDSGYRLIGVLKQFVSVFSETKGNFSNEAQILISFLSDALTFGKLSHESEQKVVEILLCLKHYPEVKKKIREWIPKGIIKECLKSEILKLSSENILQELKFNRRKDLLESKKKFKKKKRKLGDKSKKKKRKNSNKNIANK